MMHLWLAHNLLATDLRAESMFVHWLGGPQLVVNMSAGCGEHAQHHTGDNPATRNRTRDHHISAHSYSQMLCQLSYDRLHRARDK